MQQLPAFSAFFFLGVLSSKLSGQSIASPFHSAGSDNPFMDMIPGGRSPVWFFIFVGWYVFSAITSGMPEPTKESSPWYIWAYRTFHILAASGTSFFSNKLDWKDSVDKLERGKLPPA